jgi:hypothetical protein
VFGIPSGGVAGVVKTGNRRVMSLVKKKIPLGNGCIFFSWYKCFQRYFFSTVFFFRGCLEFERCVCARTAHCWSQKFSERGVGSGWRRGGMAEDLYVRKDRRWCCLVVIVVIYWYNFFFDLTSRSWRIRGYSVGVGPYRT